ncbi:hypothetical protein QVD17_38070 [Tagetes erecta]|uniref:Uncharacterized protein n=1 Tax=Tagetes erecta TaxID=13708 RepID=A0AAD8K1Q5_TARER|nr:hypothetical protein QVD17_38070 [Tagetes erecta]
MFNHAMPDFARVLTFQFAAQFMVTTFQTYANFARVLKFQTSRMIIVERSNGPRFSPFKGVGLGHNNLIRFYPMETMTKEEVISNCELVEIKWILTCRSSSRYQLSEMSLGPQISPEKRKKISAKDFFFSGFQLFTLLPRSNGGLLAKQGAYTNSLPNVLLAANGHPVRVSDLSYSQFPISQSMATKYGNSVSSISGSTISILDVMLGYLLNFYNFKGIYPYFSTSVYDQLGLFLQT